MITRRTQFVQQMIATILTTIGKHGIPALPALRGIQRKQAIGANTYIIGSDSQLQLSRQALSEKRRTDISVRLDTTWSQSCEYAFLQLALKRKAVLTKRFWGATYQCSFFSLSMETTSYSHRWVHDENQCDR